MEAAVLLLGEDVTKVLALGLRVVVLAVCWPEASLCERSSDDVSVPCGLAAVDGDSTGSDVLLLS